jgi:hypothetical protein
VHDEPCITLDVPDTDDFDESRPHVYIPVSDLVVDSGMKLLQCFVAHDAPIRPASMWARQ